MEEATMKKSIKVILAMVLAWLVMLPAQGIAAQIVQDNSAYGIQVMPRPVNEDAEKEDLQTILERQKDRDEGDAFYLKTGELKSFVIGPYGHFVEITQPYAGNKHSIGSPLIEIKYLGTEEKAQACERFDIDIVWDYFSKSYDKESKDDYYSTTEGVSDQNVVSVGSAQLQIPVQKQMVAVSQNVVDTVPSTPTTNAILQPPTATNPSSLITVSIDPTVKAVLTPTTPVIDIVGNARIQAIESSIDTTVSPAATVQVDAQTAQWIQNLYKIALEIGGTGYILFVQETQNVPALYNFLRDRKHVYSLADFDTFKKINGIDDTYIQWFNQQYQNARQSVALAQVHAYESFLLLQAGRIGEAEQRYLDAEQYVNNYREWISVVNAQMQSWKPLQGTGGGQTSQIYIASLDPMNVVPNKNGFLFVDDGATVTLRATIQSGKDQTATWQFFNNGYPTGQGATKQQSGTIQLKQGMNFVDITEQYFYKDDTLWNTGSFITVLIVDNGQGNSYYRGQSIYVHSLSQSQVSQPATEPIKYPAPSPFREIKNRCMTENDLGLEIWYYGNDEGKVKVAFNANYFKQQMRSWPYKGKGQEQDFLKSTGAPMRLSNENVKETGCRVNGDIILPGTRFISDQGGKEVPSYCDSLTRQVLPQKKIGDQAENNFECQTGIQGYSDEAGRGICKEEAVGLLKKILKFFGLF